MIVPNIEALSPSYCRVNSPLTISGASFGASQADSYVTLGSVKITEYSAWSNGLIQLKVPGGLSCKLMTLTVQILIKTYSLA
jgi:hypothetical protein